MTIQLYAWAPDRKCFIEGVTTYGVGDAKFAALDADGNPVWHPEIQVDEIGPICKGEQGAVCGHHVNLRGFGQMEAQLTAGLEQTNPDGSLKSVFERTHILTIVPSAVWQPVTENGVPAGFVGPHGVRLYDPASVANPRRVWALEKKGLRWQPVTSRDA